MFGSLMMLASGVLANRRLRITSSELELESDSRVLKRPAILEKSLALAAPTAPLRCGRGFWRQRRKV